ncbi:RNA polymerase sigma-70 factor [Rhodohalobacter mucosus]|uniref:RNA polymerase sigma factor n=1 Tax=Rhodohalobacter mucosus TaxID=2079485 RepID=A0A316TRF0_9BACT|nr:RNA polymerase sigma-70 factor [Rhodohalobacter mucosus]
MPGIESVFLILALSKSGELDDRELSIAIRKGDQKAFETFFDRHYEPVYRFLISRGMNHDEAQDLTQRAFLMIWEKRNTIDETKSLRAFLFRIAYTRMLNHIEYHSKFDQNTDPAEDSASGSAKTTEKEMEHRELLNQIQRLIVAMPEKRGTVFQLCFMKEFTYKETAETIGISIKTVENHMALAFRDIREGLKTVYGDEILNRFL